MTRISDKYTDKLMTTVLTMTRHD